MEGFIFLANTIMGGTCAYHFFGGLLYVLISAMQFYFQRTSTSSKNSAQIEHTLFKLVIDRHAN